MGPSQATPERGQRQQSAVRHQFPPGCFFLVSALAKTRWSPLAGIQPARAVGTGMPGPFGDSSCTQKKTEGRQDVISPPCRKKSGDQTLHDCPRGPPTPKARPKLPWLPRLHMLMD